jgi:hypothetical protein
MHSRMFSKECKINLHVVQIDISLLCVSKLGFEFLKQIKMCGILILKKISFAL